MKHPLNTLSSRDKVLVAEVAFNENQPMHSVAPYPHPVTFSLLSQYSTRHHSLHAIIGNRLLSSSKDYYEGYCRSMMCLSLSMTSASTMHPLLAGPSTLIPLVGVSSNACLMRTIPACPKNSIIFLSCPCRKAQVSRTKEGRNVSGALKLGSATYFDHIL